MDKLELELVDYLNENTKMLKDSLDNSNINYEYVKVLCATIDDVGFDVSVEICPDVSVVSYLKIPDKFLRKMKLNKINNV